MRAMQLETDRLILRDFKATDWKDVHEYAIDPDVVKFMEWGPNTVEQTQFFVDVAIEKQREKPRQTFEFAVVLKESAKLIGAAGLRVNAGNDRCADIGYCYNQKYWRKGYSTEACLRLMKMGFDELELHRIYATCDLENIGSAGVLKKCGMRQEAHFVQDKNIKGRWRDTLLFAILDEEWDALNAKID
jgi:RimJ/RimL family protein N-acetyltransferase